MFFLLLQGVQDLMQLHKQEIVAFEDVKDEIFDMVRPIDPLKLTLQDLIRRWLTIIEITIAKLVVSWSKLDRTTQFD